MREVPGVGTDSKVAGNLGQRLAPPIPVPGARQRGDVVPHPLNASGTPRLPSYWKKAKLDPVTCHLQNDLEVDSRFEGKSR